LIWIVTARETLDNLMSLKFLFGTVLCLALVVISTVVSLRDYQSRMDEYNTAVADFNEKPDSFYFKMYRKPEVLSIFARGFEKRFGNVAELIYMPVQARGFMGASEGAEFSAEFASIDFVFVVRVIVSLLAIFLAYDAVSGEYERGTLKLMLSRPVPRSSIILGKLIAGAICLLIPLIMSFIIGILIIQLVGGLAFTSEEWLRISLMFVVTVLCVMSFYMIGLVVSSRTRQASTSLLILLLIWIAGVFLIPGIATSAMDRYRRIASTPDKDIAAINSDFYRRKQKDPGPEYHPNNRDAYAKYRVKWDELEDERDRAIWNLRKRYLDRLYFQADLVRWICRISPSESCMYASEALARTYVGAYRNFMEYVRSYHGPHREMIKFIWKDMSKYREETEKFKKLIEVPPVTFSASLSAALPDICVLAILNVLLFMLSVLFFIRYDVH
jgi:ABC-type transport system involved in multi-copper enzyme maturation permease subunit